MIRHAFFGLRGGRDGSGAAALPVAALRVAMILAAFGAGLMAAVGGAGLFQSRAFAAWLGAVAVPAIAASADDEDLPAWTGQDKCYVLVVLVVVIASQVADDCGFWTTEAIPATLLGDLWMAPLWLSRTGTLSLLTAGFHPFFHPQYFFSSMPMIGWTCRLRRR